MYHGNLHTLNIIHAQNKKIKLINIGEDIHIKPDVTTQSHLDKQLYYIAPEQLKKETTNIFSDIYSLGCIFYHMITGEIPFSEKGTLSYEHFIKRLEETPQKPSILCKNIPQKFDPLVLSLMQPDPEERIEIKEVISNLVQLKNTLQEKRESAI